MIGRFIRLLLIFAGLLFVVYPLLIIAAGSFIPQLFRPNVAHQLGAYGYMHTRLAELKDSVRNVDVLFLGSSHAYRGFDTRNFENVSSFNLGSSAQTPLNTQVLLKRYLDKLNPKTVIYEVYPGSLSGDGSESALDIISNDKNDELSFRMILSAGNIKLYNTFIYAVFRDLFLMNDGFHDAPSQSDTYVPGGFVEKRPMHFRFHSYEEKKWELNEKQIDKFSENLELLQERDVRIILVFAPITSRLYASYTNNNQFDEMMAGYRHKYLNFNELMQLNDSLHFYDSHHLNQTGVNLFNQLLKEKLSEVF